MKSKFMLVTTLLILLSLLLVACAGGTAPPADTGAQETTGAEAKVEEPSQPEAKEAMAEEEPGEKAKVVIFIGMGTGTDPDQIAAQEAMQEEFNSTHDDIEVEFLIVPHEEAGERFLSMVAGGNAPQLVGPNGISTVAQFFDTWLDVSPLIEADKLDLSDFYGPAVSLNQYPDKVVGLPLGLFPSFLFYNADLFDAAGLDYPTHDYNDETWTLDALREMAMKLTLDGDGNDATSPDFDPENIVQWGYDDSWISATGFLATFGAPNVGRPTSDDYQTAVVNSEEWVYGFKWLNDGIWKDHFIPDAAGQEAYYAVGGDPFGGGLVAIFYSHTWFMPEGLVDLPFEHDIAPIPFNQKGTRVARIHADTFTIPRDAENKEAAWEVLKWLTSPEHIVDVCLIYGCLPARLSVQDEFLAALQDRYPGLDYDVIFEAIDYLDNPNHESWVPEWGRVQDAIENSFGAVYVAPIEDPQAHLDQANEEVQKILDEYWAKQ
jgi:multiple sugar transport system substrate-binding protein